MKKLILSLPVLILLLSSCGNNSESIKNEDSVYVEPPAGPAPDNSNATNPSLPDTTFTDSVPRK